MRLNTFRWLVLAGFLSLFMIMVSSFSSYAITTTPGGFENDPYADAVYDFDIVSPTDHPNQDQELFRALGAPNHPVNSHYVHLGCEGYITLQFTDNLIINGSDDDFRIFEESSSSIPDESAIVYVSQNGIDFVEIGTIVPGNVYSTYFDLENIGFEWVQYVKIKDAACSRPQTGYVDGFELDSVKALNSALFTYIVNTGSGFMPPMNNYPVSIRGKNRALPLKVQLYDVQGSIITDEDIQSPPVIQVSFSGEQGGEAIDVTGEAYSAGNATEGNQFIFKEDQLWQFNLKTKNYTASGTYTINIKSGDPDEYIINPPCMTQFLIE